MVTERGQLPPGRRRRRMPRQDVVSPDRAPKATIAAERSCRRVVTCRRIAFRIGTEIVTPGRPGQGVRRRCYNWPPTEGSRWPSDKRRRPTSTAPSSSSVAVVGKTNADRPGAHRLPDRHPRPWPRSGQVTGSSRATLVIGREKRQLRLRRSRTSARPGRHCKVGPLEAAEKLLRRGPGLHQRHRGRRHDPVDGNPGCCATAKRSSSADTVLRFRLYDELDLKFSSDVTNADRHRPAHGPPGQAHVRPRARVRHRRGGQDRGGKALVVDDDGPRRHQADQRHERPPVRRPRHLPGGQDHPARAGRHRGQASRFGGDEFTAFIAGRRESDGAAEVAERIRDTSWRTPASSARVFR